MSTIKANLGAAPQDVFATSTTQGIDLGAYATTGDGRVFRYAKAGATALVVGTLVQAPAEAVAAFEALTPVAAAIGAKTITLVTSPRGDAATLAAGGFIVTTTGVGAGYTYKISGASIVTTSLQLTLEDGLIVALTSASVIDVVQNPFNGVVINPTSATSSPLGVAVSAIPAANYGWIQTHGPVGISAQNALTVGLGVAPSTTTAGQVILATSTSATSPMVVGTALTGVAAGDTGLVFLSYD